MAKKMWGGRFTRKIDKEFDIFQKSVHYDYKLAEYDVYHSIIHVFALLYTKVITANEARRLTSALRDIWFEIKSTRFKYNPLSEDIHTDIQNRLEKRVGAAALKLQSFRSRNEQIIFDERCYCIIEGKNIGELISKAIDSLNWLADKYKKNFFLGYTHTQRAQVVKFSDYILSFAWMFNRDSKRIDNFLKDVEIPIGCGALAGSYIKKEDYNKAINKFIKKFSFKNLPFKILLTKNPLDNISDRDFIIEFLNILSILQMHLSRLAEDFILYSAKEFNFFALPEEYACGSSLMPHKKNPDFLELVRGYTGRLYGNLISVFVMMKGLPLTYNRDMQLDKGPLFSSVGIIKDELKILAKFIKGIKLNEKAIDDALGDESLYATELAQLLVEKGIPHKSAHTIIGRLINYSEKKKQKIKDMNNDLLKGFHPALNSKEIKIRLNPKFAVECKRSIRRSFS